MNRIVTSRRTILGGAASLAALGVGRAHAAAAPPLPTSPVSLNVIDVAGQLQLTQAAMQAYAKAHPHLVSNIAFSQAPAPELPGKIKAQQDAGSVDIDLVLTGTDGLSAGIDMKLWIPIVTDYASALPDLNEIYLPGALKMQGLAQNQAVCVVFCPAGPIIEYMPDAVKTPPKTAQALLDWTRAHKNRFMYARPANSGPGRTFLPGPALHPEGQGSDGSKRWVGQNLGLSHRAGQEHRILPDRHRCGHEGTRGRLPRHDRLAYRLGSQPAHPRRGAEGGAGRNAGRLPLGDGRTVPGRSRRAYRTPGSRCCWT